MTSVSIWDRYAHSFVCNLISLGDNVRKLNLLFNLDLRKFYFYSLIVISFVTLFSFQNCGQVKFAAPEKANVVVPMSCGTIIMSPQNGIYPTTSVRFAVVPADTVTISNLAWTFTKGNATVFSSTSNPVVRTFNSNYEGAGEYLATATYTKNDGNSCELAQSFQVLESDLCAAPSGISGPTIAFVGEETSPFSVNTEACFTGTSSWDMNGDGTPDYVNIPSDEPLTHIYIAPGTYTVTSVVTDVNEGTQTTLTHVVDVRYKTCVNPFNATQTLTHGQSITAYQAATAPFGGSCVSEQRTCNNGTLSGSFTNETCVVGDPAPCTFNGQTVPHGQSVTAYLTGSVPFGQTCTSQQRTCSNGVLSGSYTNPACTVGTASNCTLDGVTVAHGQSRTFYSSSSVACGETCQAQSRTCNNGTFSGSASYNRAACSVAACNSCNFNGQTIAHGGSVTAFEAALVGYGATCNPQTRVCTNGVLSGTFTHPSCTVAPPASCTFNGQTIVHGQSITAYLSGSVPYGQACTPQTRTCSNGTLSGSYTNPSCVVGQPSSCQLPWGGSIAHGQTVVAYASNQVACGQACQSEVRACNNGSLTGSYTRQSCSVGSCVVDSCTVQNVESTCRAAINNPAYSHHRIAPLNWKFYNMLGDAFAAGKTTPYNYPITEGFSTHAYKITAQGLFAPLNNGGTINKGDQVFCVGTHEDKARRLVRYAGDRVGYILVDVPLSDYNGITPNPNVTCRYTDTNVQLTTSVKMQCTTTGAVADPSSVNQNRILWDNAFIGMNCGF